MKEGGSGNRKEAACVWERVCDVCVRVQECVLSCVVCGGWCVYDGSHEIEYQKYSVRQNGQGRTDEQEEQGEIPACRT